VTSTTAMCSTRDGGLALWAGRLAVLLLASLVTVGLVAVSIPPGTTVRILTHHLIGSPGQVSWSRPDDVIVTQVRLPRVLLGVIVGAGLSVAGASLQAMVRNILAEPYLLGVVGGASAGAAVTILFGVGAGADGSELTGSAFAGALAAMVLVVLLGRAGGQVTPTRLLLAGVAVGFVPVSAEKLIALSLGDRNRLQPRVRQRRGTEPEGTDVTARRDQLDAVKNKRVILADDVYLTARPADAVHLLYTKLRDLG